MAKPPKKAGTKAPAAAVEDVPTVGVAPDPAVAPKVARYTSDGILLNPEDFNVQPDGTLVAKA